MANQISASAPFVEALRRGKLIEHMLASIREENTCGTELVLSVVPSVCGGLCAPSGGLLVSLSQVSSCCATKDVPQFSHLCHDAPLAITSGRVTSQSWRLEGKVLIVDWTDTSERMKSAVNDPPITIRQCCLALMNTWKLLDGNDESGN